MKKNINLGIIAMLFFYGFIFLIGYINGYNPFNTGNFSRWDSGLYATISESGYIVEKIDNTDVLNGTCGWFPLMPFLAFVLRLLFGLGFHDAAFIISFISTFALIITFLSIIDKFGENSISKEWGLFFLLSFTGNIYLAAAFPLSLCLLFMNLSILCILQKKYVLSGLFCFISCLSYSTAFLYCGVLGCYLIYECIKEKESLKNFIIKVLKAPVLGFMGFLTVHIIIFIATGNIKAFFLTQKKYGHGIHNPIKTLCGFLSNIKSENITASQQSFISFIFLLLFIFVVVIFFKEKLYLNKIYVISSISIVIIYFFLLIMGNGVSPYRQYLMCSDAALILASKQVVKKNKLTIAFFLIISSLFAIKMFFDSIIV